MNERRSDFELLRDFGRDDGEAAFANLVRRHLNLVYSTALRKTEDAGGAEEIAQNVFTILARKAWQFGPDDSLTAWLYKTTLLESKVWWRGELRRRRRDQTAAELGTTMNPPNDQISARALLPLLDEGLLSLRERERVALLLRYYEKQPLREIGDALGVNEDTAQKRVASALGKLANFFQRRGFKTATLAGTVAVLETSSISAPASTVAVVVDLALKSGPAFSGATGLLARFTGLSKAQTAVLCAVLAVGPAVWQWSSFQRERETGRQLSQRLASTEIEVSTLTSEIENLQQSAARLENRRRRSAVELAALAESRAKFEAWKKQLRERLLAANFQWTDDSPFVRIPKSLLGSLDVNTPISRPGVLSPAARELLGLTPRERETIENSLRNHIAKMDSMMESHAYQTNSSSRLPVPANAVASKILFLPALGEEAKSSGQELQSELKTVLGAERWKVLQPYWEQRGTSTLQTALNLDANENEQELAAWISQKDGKFTAQYAWAITYASTYSAGVDLSLFLPDATKEPISLPDGQSVELSPEDRLGCGKLPDPIRQQILS
ncbi:MAG TPA: sigma-70 family RNA polymerase sigma factor, partial [Candidatus Dormibacteraeota bacterium]|nr:sigma-70 family RNA polymerase sigma factor [Candidatus Dormibacteraeota bacterium]